MDDDEVIRELLELHLANAGYEVLVAEDGVLGGLALQKERPDLLLVDIDMPHFNGLELLKALDADERLAGHYRLNAVRAHLFEMAGDYESAIAHYRAAAERTTSIPERNYLTTQAGRLGNR